MRLFEADPYGCHSQEGTRIRMGEGYRAPTILPPYDNTTFLGVIPLNSVCTYICYHFPRFIVVLAAQQIHQAFPVFQVLVEKRKARNPFRRTAPYMLSCDLAFQLESALAVSILRSMEILPVSRVYISNFASSHQARGRVGIFLKYPILFV